MSSQSRRGKSKTIVISDFIISEDDELDLRISQSIDQKPTRVESTNENSKRMMSSKTSSSEEEFMMGCESEYLHYENDHNRIIVNCDKFKNDPEFVKYLKK